MERTPNGLKAAGRRLWRAVVADYDLEEHESLLLEQAARTADIVAALDAAVAGERELTTDDGRIRAEIVELRQQRIVLARLLAALRVPLGEQAEDEGHGPPRLQRRSGARGVYAIGGGGA